MNCSKIQHLAWMITQDDWEIVCDLADLCNQIVLHTSHIARIGRTVTTWNRACDKKLARLTSYLKRTTSYEPEKKIDMD